MRSLYSSRNLLLLATTLTAMATTAADGSPVVTPMVAIANGVIIAHGNELTPPFRVAVENDTLCFYDGEGRRFAGNAPEAAESANAIPRPPLLGPPPSTGMSGHPALAAAQIAHLLSTGGLVAFGQSYLRVFPASAAQEVLSDVRWVIQHAAELTGILPPGDPLLRDLLFPAPLAPAPHPQDDATLRIQDPEGQVSRRPAPG